MELFRRCPLRMFVTSDGPCARSFPPRIWIASMSQVGITANGTSEGLSSHAYVPERPSSSTVLGGKTAYPPSFFPSMKASGVPGAPAKFFKPGT
jgi:hypothetical protein